MKLNKQSDILRKTATLRVLGSRHIIISCFFTSSFKIGGWIVYEIVPKQYYIIFMKECGTLTDGILKQKSRKKQK